MDSPTVEKQTTDTVQILSGMCNCKIKSKNENDVLFLFVRRV
jgi:hypothetical protein